MTATRDAERVGRGRGLISVSRLRGRYRVARDAGHGTECALAFALRRVAELRFRCLCPTSRRPIAVRWAS